MKVARNMLIFETVFMVRKDFSTLICHFTLKEQCVYTLNTLVVESAEK
jgi:hypothetical protein